MKKYVVLLISILIPIAVGQLAALLTPNSGDIYNSLIKPPLSPPSIVFPIVWMILYVLMGISAYLIYTSTNPLKQSALKWYGIQLALNFTWTIMFFYFQNYLIALLILIVLILSIAVMIQKFYEIKPIAAYLQIPYLIWCLFAAYLNLGILLLNS